MRRFLFAALLAGLAALGPRPAPGETVPFVLGPPKGEGPVVVRAGFFLNDINEIDEVQETFAFDGVLTLRWHDPRQAFDPAEVGVEQKVYQGNYQFSEVFTGWWPQTLLANESGRYDRQGVMLRVDADGSMTYVEEMDAVAETPMRLRRFPFDRHRFEAIFEVLGVGSDEVVLEADPKTTGRWDDTKHRVRVPQWSLVSMETFVHEHMASSVVINLVVGWLDRQNRRDAGDRLDHRCRWIFPGVYFGAILLLLGLAFLVPAS